jgi:hypothetical protein
VRAITVETVSANLDALSKTDYRQPEQARIFPGTGNRLTQLTKKRQPLNPTERRRGLQRQPRLKPET